MKKALLWLEGFAVAAIGGALAGACESATSGTVTPANIKAAAISGAALTLGAYLAKSPLGRQ